MLVGCVDINTKTNLKTSNWFCSPENKMFVFKIIIQKIIKIPLNFHTNHRPLICLESMAFSAEPSTGRVDNYLRISIRLNQHRTCIDVISRANVLECKWAQQVLDSRATPVAAQRENEQNERQGQSCHQQNEQRPQHFQIQSHRFGSAAASHRTRTDVWNVLAIQAFQ